MAHTGAPPSAHHGRWLHEEVDRGQVLHMSAGQQGVQQEASEATAMLPAALKPSYLRTHRAASAGGSALMTSARPPTLLHGAHSVATKTMRRRVAARAVLVVDGMMAAGSPAAAAVARASIRRGPRSLTCRVHGARAWSGTREMMACSSRERDGCCLCH